MAEEGVRAMPNVLPLTYQAHKAKWSNCRRCPLWEGRCNVVHARGTLPADVLLVGEAPGRSEDIDGRPFRGPAGHLLDQIVRESIGEHNLHRAADGRDDLTWLMANLVGCLPIDEDGDKAGEPPADSIETCSPRLRELYRLCRPRLLVAVGALADSWLDPRKKQRLLGDLAGVKFITIYHPSYILKKQVPLAQKSLLVKKSIVTLATAVEDLDA